MGVKSSCPVTGKKCHNCSKLGHFAKMCRAPRKQKAFQQQGKPFLNNTAKQLCENKASQKQDTGDDSSDSDFVFQAVMPSKVLSTVQVRINGIKCQAKWRQIPAQQLILSMRNGFNFFKMIISVLV